MLLLEYYFIYTLINFFHCICIRFAKVLLFHSMMSFEVSYTTGSFWFSRWTASITVKHQILLFHQNGFRSFTWYKTEITTHDKIRRMRTRLKVSFNRLRFVRCANSKLLIVRKGNGRKWVNIGLNLNYKDVCSFFPLKEY